MNRELWFKILQVAIVAPWLYSHSNKAESFYFRIGLKLVAGSILMMNAPPVMLALQQLQQKKALTLQPEQTKLST